MGERFITDTSATIFSEINEVFNFELVRAMRGGENYKAVLKKDAEWLKTVLPKYIDAEVNKLISTLGLESD